MSLSVPNTFGEINQIQNQSNTVRNDSIKYSMIWIIKRGPIFWILLSCCNFPLSAANSKFQVFLTKLSCHHWHSLCHAALQHVSTTNCTFSLQKKIRMVAVDESRKSRTRRGHADESRQSRTQRGWVTAGTRPGRVPVPRQNLVQPLRVLVQPLRVAGSAYGVLNQMLGPEQPNICAQISARQWIINIISQK